MAETVSKQKLRELMQSKRTQERAEATADNFCRFARSLIAELSANTVASYHALATEPSLITLNQELADNGRLLLPKVSGSRLSWHRHEATDALESGPMGTMSPTGPEVDLGIVDLVLLPALALDLNGARLGKGGGFYDRALEHLAQMPLLKASRPTWFGVVYDSEILQALPREPHDILVHGYITESGYRWLI